MHATGKKLDTDGYGTMTD